MFVQLHEEIFERVKQTASESNIKTYLVGGYVRDIILNRPSKDIDFMLIGDGIVFANKLAEKYNPKPEVVVFKNFGTAMVKINELDVEFVGARKESYNSNSRNPIVKPGTFKDDLSRRDFTINALAISMNAESFGEITDLFGGIKDIDKGIIKTPLDPIITFNDDPLRMMRAVRFASQLGFEIENKTFEGIVNCAERITIVSMERVSDEFNKILLSPKPSVGLKLMFDTGMLKYILPELENLKGVDTIDGISHKDNFYHTLQVIDNVCKASNDLWLRWSALLHDIAKPLTKKFVKGEGWTFHGHEDKGARMVKNIFKKMRLPLNEKMKFVEKMVKMHLRPIVIAQDNVTDSAVRRLMFDAGEDIDSLLLLCKADITTKNEYKQKQFEKNLNVVEQKVIDLEQRDRIRNWQPPIDGNEIMKIFGISAGREVGILKNSLKDAILDGLIKNDYREALDFLKTKSKEIGL
ncbi:MAG: HD domain-containing protein [Bacteroidetes bacterium]|nr:HD domain-containing protein [Bacteroidota bacterium]